MTALLIEHLKLIVLFALIAAIVGLSRTNERKPLEVSKPRRRTHRTAPARFYRSVSCRF